MTWFQVELHLEPRRRGVHLVTDEIARGVPQIRSLRVGLLHLFIAHTSASLAVNENADPDVRGDVERWLSRTVPENAPYYEHTTEGPDDMPAHIKALLLGPSVLIPIRDGHLALGTWQGIYLGEHREHGGSRRVIATLFGDPKPAPRSA